MIRDCIPFPNPSNAPDAVIEKVEKRKPCSLPDTDRIRVCCKKTDQTVRNHKTDDRTKKHDHTIHDQNDPVDLLYTFVLFCSIIKADHRAHSLNDPVCRKI